MPRIISDRLATLTKDPWRASTPFSHDIDDATCRMFDAGDDSETICRLLRMWLAKYQSCLFGRLAARLDLISFCILTESDLRQDDGAIRDKIQAARIQWTRDGFAGRKSAFVILVVSPTLALATPDENLKALAQRLCSLYLLCEVSADRIYHDEIWLEKPGAERITWKWLAGVNYFCANGDGRWWQDHRIPGGMAFSINSVGHLAQTGSLLRAMKELDQTLYLPTESALATKVDSLDKSLEFAMRTIALASNTVSGKATELLPLSGSALPTPRCPVELPPFLSDKDFRYYKGYYHTDYAIPSEYFLPDIKRPNHCKARTLEFTYLFDADLENPDYVTMGAGRRIRGDSTKLGRLKPTSHPVDASQRLVRALADQR